MKRTFSYFRPNLKNLMKQMSICDFELHRILLNSMVAVMMMMMMTNE